VPHRPRLRRLGGECVAGAVRRRAGGAVTTGRVRTAVTALSLSLLCALVAQLSRRSLRRGVDLPRVEVGRRRARGVGAGARACRLSSRVSH
jgi:hypothetical protein